VLPFGANAVWTLAVSINSLIVSYGYVGVFLFVGVESVGIPVPGETALIAAGTYAGATHHLSPWGIWGAASAGAILGDNIGYWVGDKGGYRLLRRFGKYIHFDEPKIKVARYLFLQHGGKVVFLGRFVSVLRTYAAFLAGTTRMEWRRFFVFNATGGIVWSAIYSFGAYFAGQSLKKVNGTISLALIGVAVAVILTLIILIRRRFESLVGRAEEAFPGPLPD
jgi:membrane protein DedA with SNARE-associated domain